MSIETSIYTALKGLVGNRVYRDIAPQEVTTLPRITFQQVGGPAINFLDTDTLPDKNFARIQVNVWHSSRDAANTLARQVANTMRTELDAEADGEFVAVYEDDTKLYGTRQDFNLLG